MWLELIRKGIYHEGTKGTKKAGDRLLGKPATHDLAERVAALELQLEEQRHG